MKTATRLLLAAPALAFASTAAAATGWKRHAIKGKSCTGAGTAKLIAALGQLTRPEKSAASPSGTAAPSAPSLPVGAVSIREKSPLPRRTADGENPHPCLQIVLKFGTLL
ncbi:MAG: hypothetical protein LBC18_12145 [Opitutaceae bacterium]|jgi:hypothetical protein|nr:hypothetical protein [Opitutaceae bacterium]